MNRMIQRGLDAWFAPAPAERLAALRILMGAWATLYVVIRAPEYISVSRMNASHFAPTGLVKLLPGPLPFGVSLVILVATVALLVLFTLGVRFRIVGPIAALALVWATTYRTSWGMIFHTDNLLVFHVLVLAWTPATDVWARRRGPPPPPALAGYGWAIKLLAAITCGSYVLAGVAKLRVSGMDWLDGEVLRNHIAVDNLRKALLGDPIAPFATMFLDHPRLFTLFSRLSLVIELGAPLALLGNRLGKVWALNAWGFHLGVVLLMNIWFLYPLTGATFAPLFSVERPVGWVLRRLHLLPKE